MYSMKSRPIRRHAGMTLIEVLVAILIFSVGLLGFVGLQARAIRFSMSAEDSNRAAVLANEMATTMLVKNSIEPSELAADIAAWQARASDPAGVGLPNGAATAVRNGKVTTLRIAWRAPSAASAAANAENQYVTQVMLP